MTVGPASQRRDGPGSSSGRDTVRLLAATALLAGWLLLLLFGHPLGPAVHLLLGAALVVVPWRLLRP